MKSDSPTNTPKGDKDIDVIISTTPEAEIDAIDRFIVDNEIEHEVCEYKPDYTNRRCEWCGEIKLAFRHQLRGMLLDFRDQDRTRLLEQVLEVSPELAVESRNLGKDYAGYGRGYNAAIEEYKANITNLLKVKEQ